MNITVTEGDDLNMNCSAERATEWAWKKRGEVKDSPSSTGSSFYSLGEQMLYPLFRELVNPSVNSLYIL